MKRYALPSLLILLVAGALVARYFSNNRVAPVTIITDEIFAMGSNCRITIFGSGKSDTEVRAAIDSAFLKIVDVDESCSLFQDESDICRINRSAFSEDVTAGETFSQCLDRALLANKLTGGVFNPLLRPLLASWGFEPGSKSQVVPTDEAITKGIELSDISLLNFDPLSRTVRFGREGMGIDLNGIAQGFATEQAANELRGRGVTNALIESGGGEFALIGAMPNGAPFRIGIKKPSRESNDIICRVLLSDVSLATSGDYEKFFTVDGTNYSHLIDPETGRPKTGNKLSVTVIGPSCTMCDALATVCAIIGPENALELLSGIVEYEAIIVERTGEGDKFHCSPGIGRKEGDFFLLRQAGTVERPN